MEPQQMKCIKCKYEAINVLLRNKMNSNDTMEFEKYFLIGIFFSRRMGVASLNKWT
jgi:hypothetical protein